MFWKVLASLVLLAVVLAMSGCCSCRPFLPTNIINDNGSTDGNLQTNNTHADSGSTDPGDASMLIGDEWTSSAYLSYEDSSGNYVGDDIASESVQFFENGTFVSVGAAVRWSNMGFVIRGHYHVTGNTIKFTDVVEYNYPDAEQSQYTTRNIAETTGTFTVDTTSYDNLDLLEIQVPDLWAGSKQSFSRYKR
ncbi:MAG TPA: hypothetical protein VK436_16995 [Methanocella sp.]|nr:hypothetical protein [Methanocella sp.]